MVVDFRDWVVVKNSHKVLFQKRNCSKKRKPKLDRNLLRRALLVEASF